MPWPVELDGAPLFAVTLLEGYRQQAAGGNGPVGAMEGIAELIAAQVQQDGVGQHRVVWSA